MDDNDAERTRARLLHVEEAAKLLSIGRIKAYELIANGQLHAIRLGRATRISSREVDRSSAASTASVTHGGGPLGVHIRDGESRRSSTPNPPGAA
jgi:excisionase family DNA binding protein